MTAFSKLTGLACIVAAAPAFAQSSVVLAGRLDLGPQYIQNGTNMKRLDSGTYTASRLIFRGTEDLGDGLGAFFYLEHRFNADVGAAQSATKFWNAGAQVGLSSKTWGSIVLGRQYVPMFWPFLFADDTGPLRLHGYSAVQSIQRSNFARVSSAVAPVKAAGSLDTIGSGVYALSITSAFEDNLVVYKSPNIGGATFQLAAGAAEGAPAGSGRVLGANVEYRIGGLYAGAAYNQKRGTVPAGGTGSFQTVDEAVVTALYAFAPQGFHVWGNFHPWRLNGPATNNLKGRDGMIGVSYWWPADELWVNYAAKRIDNCTSCGSRGLGVGLHHLLSKKTELYASYGMVNNDANSGNSLNGVLPLTLGHSMRGYAAGLALTF